MRAINTIPKEEYAERLFKAMRHISKKIRQMAEEEDSLYMQAKDNDDEDRALKHWFNSMALGWASQSIVIAPNKLKERLEVINRREFAPTNNKER